MLVLSEMYPQKFTRALGLLAELAVETKLPLLPKVCMPMSCWLVGVDKMDLFPVIKRHVHHVQLTDLSLLNDLEWIRNWPKDKRIFFYLSVQCFENFFLRHLKSADTKL